MPAAKTVFMFSGQGSQYYQMGKQLFDENAVFRDWMLRLDGLAQRLSGRRVLEAIYSAGKGETFDRTALTHPAIFMVEYALAQCLIEAGVKPDLTLGASLGSFAAATVSGHLQVEHAMAAVVAQAQAFENACERGGMIAVLAEPTLYDEPFLHEHSEMAGVNFDRHFAVSAGWHQLDAIDATLKQRGIAHQRLAVSYAFHSRWVDNARDEFMVSLSGIPQASGTLPLACCAQAAILTQLPETFFWNVVRRPIRFLDTVTMLERQGPWRYIDAGPSGTLATFVKYALPAGSHSSAHALLTPYGQDRKNLAALLAA